MFRRNIAVTGFSLGFVNATTGAAVTTGTPTGFYTLDGGTQTAIAGAFVHEGNGQWSVNLTAGEMNGVIVGLVFVLATAINVHFTIKTVAVDGDNATTFGVTNMDVAVSGRMATYTQPTGFLAATFPGTVASSTNITAATGIVLSGVTHTGAVIPTVSAVTGLTASNLDAAVSSRMATYTQPTGFLAATFPTGTVANTTNITAGTVTTATNVTTVNGLAANVITAASIADGAIDRATFAADTGLVTIRSNTATAGAATTITLDAGASAVTNFYINALITITGGVGVGQGRFITAYNGTTRVATVSGWATIPDATSTFAITSFDSVPGATAPTAAQNATAVWEELTATARSAGTYGLLVRDNVNATIGSRMATYTQPTGFLAATFPGTVASPTNITAGVITTVTTLTNLPAITANWLTAAGIAAGALNGRGDWNIGKTAYVLTQTFPTNFAATVISAGGTVAGDVIAVASDTGSATKLRRVLLGNATATVGAGSSTASIVTSAMNPGASAIDQFKGRIITFDDATTTATLRGQSTDITANTAAGVLTVTALTTAPVSGDTFTVS